MLKLLKRWLGWDADSTMFDFSDLRPRQSPKPTVSQSAAPAPPVKQHAVTPSATPPKRRDKSKKRDPLDVLDNPRLTLDKPDDDGIDPYNTGAFNRSKSWERIGRQKKR